MTEKSKAELEHLHLSVVDFGKKSVGMLKRSIDVRGLEILNLRSRLQGRRGN